MLNLLTAERIKIIRSKKFWIVLGILTILPIMQAVNSQITVNHGKELVQVIDTVINGATGILMIEKNGLTVLLIISAFICFFIGEEFQNGTIRNVLSLGRSRIHYYLSKFLMAALVSLFGVIVLTALGMISFTVVFGFGEVAEINHYFVFAIKSFITLYILILANVSVYVMIGFLTKNSGISLIWCFLYTIATGFLPDIFQQTSHFKQVTEWFTETFLFYSDFANPSHIAKYPEMVLVSLLTIVVSSTLGILCFNRTDIK
ncbi:ABC-2 type transport system permease protein [Salinibacillus kushneri]|uniref:ABC-2 type transport system permease protein n=1 Tax=Salinibacillus kushneri TaxID=237682 RepID=A0A1I0FQH7_9BACI|nr:ABC transporter permease [Salinibacillus kushneri]SET60636.1 ABC-2 type transport system permease protein [Salinibacillus kushneri]